MPRFGSCSHGAGFPRPVPQRQERCGTRYILMPVYDEHEINAWVDRVRGLLAGLIP